MNRNPIRVTAAGILRAKFTDSAGDPIQATSLEVSLFEPGLNPNTDIPTASGLTPSYLGEGIYQLEITAQAPGGTWTDKWTGNILGTETTANFSFEVLDSGAILEAPVFGATQNNLIEVTLTSGVAGLNGRSLDSEHSFFFTTELAPVYSDPRKVRLDAGGFIGSISDYSIWMAILETSLEVDAITFTPQIANLKLFQHARREYTTCKAASLLAMNVMGTGGILQSKRLADFQVDYDTSAVQDMLDEWRNKCRKWQPQIEAGGGLRHSRMPRGVIKGELDPDRPKIGRGWSEVATGEMPIGNKRTLPVGRRRYKKTYRSRKSKKGYGDEW